MPFDTAEMWDDALQIVRAMAIAELGHAYLAMTAFQAAAAAQAGLSRCRVVSLTASAAQHATRLHPEEQLCIL